MIKKGRKLILGLIALIAVFNSPLASEAAEVKAPITLEADHLYFNDSTGEVFAKGNAVLTQKDDKVISDLIRANTKENMIWIDDKVTFLHDKLNFLGTKLTYNYDQKTGSMDKAKASIEREDNIIEDSYFHREKPPILVNGEFIQFAQDKSVINAASVTTCDKDNPDYRISADKIEIWPGEKMIIHNAGLYIKNKRIFSLPKQTISLQKKEDSKGMLPRIGYDSQDGFKIAQYLEYPIANKTAVFTDIVYYSKRDFQPSYGLVNKTEMYSLKLQNAKEKNGDDEWIEKKSDVLFKLNPYRLGNSSVSASFTAEIGDWREDNVQGWRQGYGVYFSHDPIKLSSRLTLNLGTGYETIHYNYNDTKNNIWRINAQLKAVPNEKLELWTGYNYAHQTGISPYEFDKIDNPHELKTGFMYRVGVKDGIGVETVYDLGNDTLKDVDYTWRRDLHCWETELTYRAKREQWKMKLINVAW